IRVAARWYQSHLGDSAKVLLVTNDRDNKRKATEEGLNAETVESYVRSLAQPGLLDLVVVPSSGDVAMEDVEDLRPSKRKIVYNEVYTKLVLIMQFSSARSCYNNHLVSNINMLP
uniref:PIN domain-containing protein n=1 Tax=Aegilops tauschii subsp. strangulata TaxID=200361 RepID=A0A453J2J0_AEGTS